MAEIRDKLVLEDGFSGPLERYAEKMEQANRASLRGRDIEAEISALMSENAEKAAEAANKEMAEKILLMKLEQQAQALRDRAKEQAEAEARAQEEAAEAAERAAQRHERLVGVFKQLGNVLTSPIRALPRLARGIQNVVQKIAGARTPIDNLSKTITRTAMGLFTARRMITYIKNALERAPEEMAGGIQRMAQMFKDSFDRAVLSLVRGFLPAMDRLNDAVNGKGQTLMRAFAQAMELVGQAVGFVVDKIAELVNWAGDHMNQVLIIGATLLGLFAVKMLAMGAATVMANWWLFALIGVVIAMANAFDAVGGEASTVIEKIGAGFGYLYATIYNIAASIWNEALAPLGEAFATFLDDPLQGAAHIFWAFVNSLLAGLAVIANAIDSLFGTNASGWIAGAQASVNERLAEFDTNGKAGRLGKLDPKGTAKEWGEKASSLAEKFSETNLQKNQLTELQDINKNTGATAKKVDMAAEDLKAFVDMAERDYVMRVNLQSVTPNITVNGQNTGNTREDAEALADRLAAVLAEQRTSSPSVPVDYLYTGGIG